MSKVRHSKQIKMIKKVQTKMMELNKTMIALKFSLKKFNIGSNRQKKESETLKIDHLKLLF